MTNETGGFLLFAGQDYYPNGGWDDFAGRFVSIVAAKAYVAEQPARVNHINHHWDWAHIVLGDQIITSWNSMHGWSAP